MLIVVAALASGEDSAPVPAPDEEPVADGGSAPSDEPAPADEPVRDEPVGDATADDDPSPPAGQGTPAVAGLGDTVADGAFAFTVTALECGEQSVGPDLLKEEAQGQFCLLDLEVTNIGNQAQLLATDAQYLVDRSGREFSVDDLATMALEPDSLVFAEQINPGNSFTGTLVFDVPPDAEIARAQLHDSLLSDGVEVDVGGSESD